MSSCLPAGGLLASLLLIAVAAPAVADQRPNILLAISDDQSYPHASAYGCQFVNTPSFDRVAKAGTLFTEAYVASPGCSPSRAALLTGRYPWELREAGTHASGFPDDLPVYPEVLAAAGYHVGYTGKGWGPGKWQLGARKVNPAGPHFPPPKLPNGRPTQGISNKDYAAAFAGFLEKREPGQPFCFWFGANEPHRAYESGSGLKAGKELDSVRVPTFLPDNRAVRSDLLDYALEIEHFDRQLGKMLQILDEADLIHNTIVVVTSDNGMPFPRAKANCYEYGVHVPLAVAWPAKLPAGRVHRTPVSLVDLAPTFLEAAGAKPMPKMRGVSLTASVAARPPAARRVFFGRERHSSSRYKNWGYPQRGMRQGEILVVRNYHPDRWPAGDPYRYVDNNETLGPYGAFHDIDASPTLEALLQRRGEPEVARLLQLAVDKRPRLEIYNVEEDPGCLRNLAEIPANGRYVDTLEEYLAAMEDPRYGDEPDIFEGYPRYSSIRMFPPPGKYTPPPGD